MRILMLANSLHLFLWYRQGHSVTTPHASRGRGFWNDAGVSSHTVRSVHPHRRALLTDLRIGWHTGQFDSLMLLPEGTIYLGTCKHYSVVRVQRTLHVFFLERTQTGVFPRDPAAGYSSRFV
jgi:hypothetical protein